MKEINLPHDHGRLPEQLISEKPKGETFSAVAELMKLISDEKRMEIFWLLCHCEECVINISAMVDMSSPAVSHHLKLLKNAGLVISRREGKEVYYTAARTPRSEILHEMVERIVDLSCPAEEAFDTTENYDSSVQTVNGVHDLLVSQLDRRYTIDELGKMFHINQTTLKIQFKRVFGSPMATYMKEYRMKRAAELLSSDMTIAEVARAVGYESGSKFTQAFKSVIGVLPKEYRK